MDNWMNDSLRKTEKSQHRGLVQGQLAWRQSCRLTELCSDECLLLAKSELKSLEDAQAKLMEWLRAEVFPEGIVNEKLVLEKTLSGLPDAWSKGTYGVEVLVVLSKDE